MQIFFSFKKYTIVQKIFDTQNLLIRIKLGNKAKNHKGVRFDNTLKYKTVEWI
jgi:hypothetical protein